MSEGDERKAKLADQQARGARAEKIINDPLVTEAFDKMRQRADRTRRESAIDDVALRELCYQMEKAVESFEAEFKLLVTTGRFATEEMKTLKDEEKGPEKS